MFAALAFSIGETSTHSDLEFDHAAVREVGRVLLGLEVATHQQLTRCSARTSTPQPFASATERSHPAGRSIGGGVAAFGDPERAAQRVQLARGVTEQYEPQEASSSEQNKKIIERHSMRVVQDYDRRAPLLLQIALKQTQSLNAACTWQQYLSHAPLTGVYQASRQLAGKRCSQRWAGNVGSIKVPRRNGRVQGCRRSPSCLTGTGEPYDDPNPLRGRQRRLMRERPILVWDKRKVLQLQYDLFEESLQLGNYERVSVVLGGT